RDRNAAWFTEQKGAKILFCSEIGSEGRNFQFAQHLVMFDLPVNPELIVQRIGRLDRIGQKGKIHIHIPYIKESGQEVIAAWYSSGVDIFKKDITGAHFIFKRFKKDLLFEAQKANQDLTIDTKNLKKLIKCTKEYKEKFFKELNNGRDRLLELNSFMPGKAEHLIKNIEETEKNQKTDQFILKLFNHFLIETDEIEKRIFNLNFDHTNNSQFPVPPLKKDGMTITFDRKTAVTRENIDFITMDHPMVLAAMELILGTEQGNNSMVEMSDTGKDEIILESIFVLEAIAPKKLHIDRFMPLTPVRTVVNHENNDVTENFPFETIEKKGKDLKRSWIDEHSQIVLLIQNLVKKGRDIAEKKAAEIITRSKDQASKITGKELNRLKYLQQKNKSIRNEEIKTTETEMNLMLEHIAGARLRLDAIRLIINHK
ncbi:MAG: helicase-related protein, partial [Thermodesulfobacteriota bacterium]|nr:helicase-related protein [Thermodesulfobacteriota bacterium]